jgi:hypothetical protein
LDGLKHVGRLGPFRGAEGGNEPAPCVRQQEASRLRLSLNNTLWLGDGQDGGRVDGSRTVGARAQTLYGV